MRWLGIFAIVVASFVGCSLEDALEGAPCNSDDDCLGEQTCVKTAHQEAAEAAGLCRSDGQCVAGEQEGCIASGGTCENFLFFVTCIEGTDTCYCCDSSDASLTNFSEDMRSAQCVSCPTDLCSGNGDATESCSEGEPRCVVMQDTCGCRVPEDRIENTECDDASSCGEGFVCTRTLEQQEEPEEELPENQAVEPGWCRPAQTPECAGGQQEGCRTDDSCSGVDLRFTANCTSTGRCYCCGDPASNDFNVHVYTDTAMGESAACVECPKSCDPGTSTCTMLEDPECVVTSGSVCGCTMPS